MAENNKKKTVVISKEERSDVLNFTDMYITLYELGKSFLFYQESKEPKRIDKKYNAIFKEFIYTVLSAYKSNENREDFIVTYEGRYFRACIMTTINGQVIAVRQTAVNLKDLNTLGLKQNVLDELKHERLNRGGLILIVGSPGNGKTTTSSALLIKRLELYGGLCITIEDPPEVPLDGPHGKGICIQTQVKKEGFSSSIKTSMRSYPTGQNSILFVGEVRDGKTAVNVLKASIDGRLVITTLHADSPTTAIQRLTSLAINELGDDSDEAYRMIAEAFRIAVHQRLRSKKNNNNKFQLETKLLVNTASVVNNIKNKNLAQLNTQMEMQEKALENGKRLEYTKDD